MTVQAWLDGERDYEVGRQLYEQLGDNARLKQVLGHGPSSYNQEALVWELGKLARTQLTDIDVRQSAAEMTKEVRKENVDSGANATDSLQNVTKADESLPSTAAALLLQLSQARRPLYDERLVLHQGLEHEPTDADRLAVARRILQLSREVHTSWQTTGYVQEHHQLPPGPQPAPGLDTLSREELLKKRNNLRSQVSKLKKRPDRAADLAAAEATLSRVETLLTPAA